MDNLPENSLICRPDKSLWFIVVIFLGLSLCIPVSIWTGARPLTPQDDVWAAMTLSALFGIPALAVAWYLIHCRIVAQSSGLAFFSYFRRHYYEWSYIEDYELRIPLSSQSKSGLPVAFLKVGGRWRSISPSYIGCDVLLERIALEARWSKARAWQRNDLREDGDWPKTFVYKDSSGWKLVWTSLLFSLALIGLTFLKAATYGWRALQVNMALTWSGLPLWGRIGLVFMPMLIFAPISLIYLAQYFEIRTRRKYIGQTVTATHEGLSYLKNGTKLFVLWSEIDRYYLQKVPGNLQPMLCIVESRGGRIEFLSGISGDKTLMALVRQRATNSTKKSWTYLDDADEDVLGGKASLWRDGKVGIGAKIHHFRTHTMRAFILAGIVIFSAHSFQLKTGYLGNGKAMTQADVYTGIFMLLSLAALILCGALAYCYAWTRCDKNGLYQNSLCGKRFLAWSEIKGFENNGLWMVVTGKRNKIRLVIFIADPTGLQEEIESLSGTKLRTNKNAF